RVAPLLTATIPVPPPVTVPPRTRPVAGVRPLPESVSVAPVTSSERPVSLNVLLRPVELVLTFEEPVSLSEPAEVTSITTPTALLLMVTAFGIGAETCTVICWGELNVTESPLPDPGYVPTPPPVQMAGFVHWNVPLVPVFHVYVDASSCTPEISTPAMTAMQAASVKAKDIVMDRRRVEADCSSLQVGGR